MYVQPTAQSMGAPPPYAGPHAPQQQPYAPQQQPYAPQGSYGAQPSASTYPKT
jgi:hypothetical protein